MHLYQAAKTLITRHRKIKGATNPHDQEWEVYFQERLKLRTVDNLKGYRRLLQSRLEQDGKCLVCGQKLDEESDWNVHHLWQVKLPKNQKLRSSGNSGSKVKPSNIGCGRRRSLRL
jgi:hypothetical protein